MHDRTTPGARLLAGFSTVKRDGIELTGTMVATVPIDLRVGALEERVNEIDIRIAKILRLKGTRTNIGFDIYNLVNSNAVLNYNTAFIPGGAWLRPTSVLTPRFVKFSAQVDF